MSEFQKAVELVETTLREYQDRGVDLRASAAALEQLASLPPEPRSEPVSSAPARAEVPAPASERRPSPERPAAAPARKPAAAALVVTAPAGAASQLAPAEGTKAGRLAAMRGPVLACTNCPHLVTSRTQVVFGVGNPEAELMFVGEAPGEDEDKQGEPFVGKAGQLLTRIIETMGFARSDVYIANVLKCRPDMAPGMPGNRKPLPKEMQTCLPYLREQISIIQPRLIVALGATAMEGLTGSTETMSRLRGNWHDFQGTPLMATYHPAYLLRNQSLSEKRKVWEDMLLVLGKLGKTITEKQRGYFLQK
jgi:DNA polymerase